MKVLLVGDVHADLNFLQYCINYAQENECEKIIQLGDFGYYPYQVFGIRFLEGIETEVPIYWIDGNHEDFSMLTPNVTSPAEVAPNVFYMPRGYTWQLGEMNAMALGGAYSIDRRGRTKNLDWFEEEVLNYQDIDKACSATGIDVMFTHDCPLGVPIQTILGSKAREIEEAIPNRRALQGVFDVVKPKYLFHGHYHRRYQTELNGCKIVGLDCNNKRNGDSVYVLDTEQVKLGIFLETGTWNLAEAK